MRGAATGVGSGVVVVVVVGVLKVFGVVMAGLSGSIVGLPGVPGWFVGFHMAFFLSAQGPSGDYLVYWHVHCQTAAPILKLKKAAFMQVC